MIIDGRGDPAPTSDMYDPVDMIGHNLITIEDDVFIPIWNLIPHPVNHFTHLIKNHCIIHNLTKNFNTVMRTDCDTVESRLRIIISL